MIREQKEMDRAERFRQACNRAFTSPGGHGGIGTLGEKTLHAVLKNYYEPKEINHEVRFGRYVADIAGEAGIIEIQTRQFNRLRKKLEFFLPRMQVTVVYPIAVTKWLIWIDEQTGETTKKRKSPKRGTPCDAFYELYKIRKFLIHPNFHLRIVLLELEEYRALNGWSEDKKKGSTRYDRIPAALLGELDVCGPGDYAKLIPDKLEEPFTSKDFQKAGGISPSASQIALNVLGSVGAVTRIGKQGRRYLYTRTKPGV